MKRVYKKNIYLYPQLLIITLFLQSQKQCGCVSLNECLGNNKLLT